MSRQPAMSASLDRQPVRTSCAQRSATRRQQCLLDCLRPVAEQLESRFLLSLYGQTIYPSDYPLNQKIDTAPAMANSDAMINYMENFATGTDSAPWDGGVAFAFANNKKAWNTVDTSVPEGQGWHWVDVVDLHGWDDTEAIYADPYTGVLRVPMPDNNVMDGETPGNQDPNISLNNDRHMIVYDVHTHKLYELYQTSRPDQKWSDNFLYLDNKFDNSIVSDNNVGNDAIRVDEADGGDFTWTFSGTTLVAGQTNPLRPGYVYGTSGSPGSLSMGVLGATQNNCYKLDNGVANVSLSLTDLVLTFHNVSTTQTAAAYNSVSFTSTWYDAADFTGDGSVTGQHNVTKSGLTRPAIAPGQYKNMTIPLTSFTDGGKSFGQEGDAIGYLNLQDLFRGTGLANNTDLQLTAVKFKTSSETPVLYSPDPYAWHVGDMAVHDVTKRGFTTATTAGGIAYGAMMARPDEALPVDKGGQGVINHALYLQVDSKWLPSSRYLFPAMIDAAQGIPEGRVNYFYQGMRLRLKSSWDISNLNPTERIVATALKEYGAILNDQMATGGGGAFIDGIQYMPDQNNNFNSGWTWDLSVGGVKIPIGAFEWVDLSPRVTGLSATSGTAGQSITISGKNFSYATPIDEVGDRFGHPKQVINSPGIYVFFGDQPATITARTDTTLTVTVPTLTSSTYNSVAVRVQSGVKPSDVGQSSLAGMNTTNNVNGAVFGYGTSREYFTFTYTGAPGGTQANPAAPPAVQNLTATADNGSVTLNWSAVSGATSYDLYRTISGGAEGGKIQTWPNNVTITGVTSPYTDLSVVNGTTYYYQVVARNGALAGPPSNEVSIMPNAVVAVRDASFQSDRANTVTRNYYENQLTGFSANEWIQARYSPTTGWTYLKDNNWGAAGATVVDTSGIGPHNPSSGHKDTIAGVWDPSTDNWAANPIASNLTGTDIDSPGRGGSATFNNGVWTVSGGGAGVQGTSDQFLFANNVPYDNWMRNNITGWVGARINASNNNRTITKLGRYVLQGNTGTHRVRLVDAADPATVVAEVTIDTNGAPINQIKYADVNVTLQKDHTYYLVSEEFSGGDKWFDIIAPHITRFRGSEGGVYQSGGAWVTVDNPGRVFGPVDYYDSTSANPVDRFYAIGSSARRSEGIAFATFNGFSSGPSGRTAGLMWRDGLTANAPTAYLYVSDSTIGFSYRNTSGGSINTSAVSYSGASVMLRLQNFYNSADGKFYFSGWYSTDSGTNWAQIGVGVAVTMSDPRVGLAISANDNSDLATATFSQTCGGAINPFPNGSYDGSQVAWVDGNSTSGYLNGPITAVGTATNAGSATWVGAKITVGATDLYVTQLGRYKVPGNSGSHTLKLIDATTKQDVPGSSVMVSLSGKTDRQVAYTALANPVKLLANTSYYLVSSETPGTGDQWLDAAGTVVSTIGSDASIAKAVYSTNGTAWTETSTAGHEYGPVDLRYASTNSNAIVQQTNVTLESNTRYTVTVAVGDRMDTLFGGYQIQLLAGTVDPVTGAVSGTLLQSLVSQTAPVNDGFGDVTITYDAPASGAMIGQKLLIVLGTNPVNNTYRTPKWPMPFMAQSMPQTNFDNVRVSSQGLVDVNIDDRFDDTHSNLPKFGGGTLDWSFYGSGITSGYAWGYANSLSHVNLGAVNAYQNNAYELNSDVNALRLTLYNAGAATAQAYNQASVSMSWYDDAQFTGAIIQTGRHENITVANLARPAIAASETITIDIPLSLFSSDAGFGMQAFGQKGDAIGYLRLMDLFRGTGLGNQDLRLTKVQFVRLETAIDKTFDDTHSNLPKFGGGTLDWSFYGSGITSGYAWGYTNSLSHVNLGTVNAYQHNAYELTSDVSVLRLTLYNAGTATAQAYDLVSIGMSWYDDAQFTGAQIQTGRHENITATGLTRPAIAAGETVALDIPLSLFSSDAGFGMQTFGQKGDAIGYLRLTDLFRGTGLGNTDLRLIGVSFI